MELTDKQSVLWDEYRKQKPYSEPPEIVQLGRGYKHFKSWHIQILNSEIQTNLIESHHFDSKKLALDLTYLEMARIWSLRSYCVRKKVGALLVKDNQIIADGYNGTPRGYPNICEVDPDTTHWYVLHAEQNIMQKLARGTQSSIGSTLYVTSSPCPECSKFIVQAGIERVVFTEYYRDTRGLTLLLNSGIQLSHFELMLDYQHEECMNSLGG